MSVKVKTNGEWVTQVGGSAQANNASGSINGAVLYSQTQELTDTEKARARNNIDSPSMSDIPTATSDLENDSGFLVGTDPYLLTPGKAADSNVVGERLSIMGDSLSSYNSRLSSANEIWNAIHKEFLKMTRKTSKVAVTLEGLEMTILEYLEDGATSEIIITMDVNYTPLSMSVDGHTFTMSWSGF